MIEITNGKRLGEDGKMRDPKRIKRILELIEKIWDKSPDQRFGQLLINCGIVDDSLRVWNNEDNTLEEYLNKFLEEVKDE